MPQLPPFSPSDPPQRSPKSSVLQWLIRLITIAGFFLFLTPFFFFLTWMIGNVLDRGSIADRTYQVGSYQIREQIQSFSGWPDTVYERIYTLKNGWQRIELGKFRSEDDRGIGIKAAAPKMVGDWLVVFSANHVFLWQPDREKIAFEPYLAKDWMSYSNLGINGHYDYHATDFLIEGDRWIFEYRCAQQPCQMMNDNKAMPERIRFVSDDGGKTFDVLEPTFRTFQ